MARVGRVIAVGIAAFAAMGSSGAGAARTPLFHALLATRIPAADLPAGWVLGNIQPMPSVDANYVGVQTGTHFDAAVYASLRHGRQQGVVSWFFTRGGDVAADLVAKLARGTTRAVSRPLALKIALPGRGDAAWVLPTGSAVANVGEIVIEAVPDLARAGSQHPSQAAALLRLGVTHLRDATRAQVG